VNVIYEFGGSIVPYHIDNKRFLVLIHHLKWSAGNPVLNAYISLLHVQIGCYSCSMNKRSVKRQPAKASRNPVLRKAVSRQVSGKPEPNNAVKIAAATVAHQVAARSSILRTHKFRVGQTVFYTSSPISRPGASGSYKVVRLLPSDGDDYQYRIKNSGEAFERVARESQLEVDH
jgi:hypothetical protein